jgi:hypothetical protein
MHADAPSSVSCHCDAFREVGPSSVEKLLSEGIDPFDVYRHFLFSTGRSCIGGWSSRQRPEEELLEFP